MLQQPPLATIPVNKSPRRELSHGTKHQLQGRSFAGQTATEIATAEAILHETVHNVLHRAEHNNNVDNNRQTGRPKKITPRAKTSIVY